MRRREFIAGLGAGAFAAPLEVRAQQPAIPLIGFLSGRSRAEVGPALAEWGGRDPRPPAHVTGVRASALPRDLAPLVRLSSRRGGRRPPQRVGIPALNRLTSTPRSGFFVDVRSSVKRCSMNYGPLIIRNRSLQISVFLAWDEADTLQGCKMLLGFRDLALD